MSKGPTARKQSEPRFVSKATPFLLHDIKETLSLPPLPGYTVSGFPTAVI